MTKKYKLLKDTYDGMKKGMIGILWQETGEYDFKTSYGKGWRIDKTIVEDNSEWFQEIVDDYEECEMQKFGMLSSRKFNRMQDQLQYIHNLAAVKGREPYTMLIYYERQKREADKIIQECGYNVKTMLVSDLPNGSVFKECTMDELHNINTEEL